MFFNFNFFWGHFVTKVSLHFLNQHKILDFLIPYTVNASNFDMVFAENIFFPIFYLGNPISNFLTICLKLGTMRWQNTIFDFASHSPWKNFFAEVSKLPTVFLTSTGTSTLLNKWATARAVGLLRHFWRFFKKVETHTERLLPWTRLYDDFQGS